MDTMVIKYLGLAALTYGTHAYLALAQVLLSLYLIINGCLLLTSKESLGKWANRLGFVANQELARNKPIAPLMLATGIAFILPLFGVSYWIAVLACPFAIFLIIKAGRSLTSSGLKVNGGIVRTGFVVSAFLICSFTVWEERDLVHTGYSVNYKSIYWRNKEVSVWQQENNPNVPKIGEMAPDFELSDYAGAGTMRLSDYRGDKPVVLLFGSFT